MPKKEKGKSHSTRPVSRRSPSWCKYQPEEAEALIAKLAKEGHSPSMIGTILRDRYAIPLTRSITGKSVTRILEDVELAPSMPEDLDNLIRKATKLAVHLERHKTDLHNKRALQIVEAKIHRLSKYYKRAGILPEDWKFRVRTTTIT